MKSLKISRNERHQKCRTENELLSSMMSEYNQKIRNDKEKKFKESMYQTLRPKIQNEIYATKYREIEHKVKKEIETELEEEMKERIKEEIEDKTKKEFVHTTTVELTKIYLTCWADKKTYIIITHRKKIVSLCSKHYCFENHFLKKIS